MNFLDNYLSTPTDANSPLLNLVDATLDTSLPPATIITDGIDPIMSEGQTCANRLQSAGITVRYRNYTGVSQEFFSTGAVVDVANQAVQYAAQGLLTAFNRPL